MSLVPFRHKYTHRHFHITYRPSDNTQTDIHTLPSRLLSQLFEHSCQNSETSNTTIVRAPVKKSAKNPKHTNSCWSDTYGRLKYSKQTLRRLDPCSSYHIFFSTVLPHSHYSPLLCLIPFLSTSQSNLFLFFFPPAPGRVHCCLASALITARRRPPSTSRLTCESTRPRAGITLKSSKSGHVKLTEVFREPTQVSEGVSWKLAQGQICMSKHTLWFRL